LRAEIAARFAPNLRGAGARFFTGREGSSLRARPARSGSRQTISEIVTELLSLRVNRLRTQVLIAAEALLQSGERRRAKGRAAITTTAI
jgi:hypothetical protein